MLSTMRMRFGLERLQLGVVGRQSHGKGDLRTIVRTLATAAALSSQRTRAHERERRESAETENGSVHANLLRFDCRGCPRCEDSRPAPLDLQDTWSRSNSSRRIAPQLIAPNRAPTHRAESRSNTVVHERARKETNRIGAAAGCATVCWSWCGWPFCVTVRFVLIRLIRAQRVGARFGAICTTRLSADSAAIG